MLAATATATKEVRRDVISRLNMGGCEDVFVSPNQPNIYYEVRLRTTIEDDLAHLVESHRKKAERVIIYCYSLNLCADLHAHFHAELGDDSYYPPGDLQQDALSHFRKSEPAMRAFQNHQKAMQTPNHCLIQDVSIQWNSTYQAKQPILKSKN